MNRSRILCVDDNYAFLTTLRLALEYGGYEVIAAVHGVDALRQFRAYAGNFDVILTDHEMPQMNGLEFVRAVHHEGFKGRIIIMSGNFELEDFQAYLTFPISRFVHKPFEVSSILATLARQD